MAGLDTYVQLRQAEDVQDEIYNISPIDNPVASMSRTIRATGKIHEWTEDSLSATKVNAAVEGAAAGDDTSTPVVELQNYCQIMTEVAEITGGLAVIAFYWAFIHALLKRHFSPCWAKSRTGLYFIPL